MLDETDYNCHYSEHPLVVLANQCHNSRPLRVNPLRILQTQLEAEEDTKNAWIRWVTRYHDEPESEREVKCVRHIPPWLTDALQVLSIQLHYIERKKKHVDE